VNVAAGHGDGAPEDGPVREQPGQHNLYKRGRLSVLFPSG
jgi:hypothetical protein